MPTDWRSEISASGLSEDLLPVRQKELARLQDSAARLLSWTNSGSWTGLTAGLITPVLSPCSLSVHSEVLVPTLPDPPSWSGSGGHVLHPGASGPQGWFLF